MNKIAKVLPSNHSLSMQLIACEEKWELLYQLTFMSKRLGWKGQELIFSNYGVTVRDDISNILIS